MRLKRILQVLVVMLVSTGLTLTACGPDETGNNNGLNVGEDNQNQNQENQNQNQENQNQENQNQNQENQNQVPGGTVELADPPPSCEDPDPPARCAVDNVDEYDEYGPASLVTTLALADSSCCFDFDKDGRNDNALPSIVGLIPNTGGLAGINETIQENIDNGSVTIILEHNGLTELADGAEYDVSFLLGEKDEDNDGVNIDVASFEQGVYPQALLPNAKLTQDGDDLKLEAGPGTVVIELNLFDLDLRLGIRNAMLEGYIEDDSLDGGVNIVDGKIGGVLIFEDLVKTLNDVVETCDCLGNPVDFYDLEAGECKDVSDIEAGACDAEGICGDLLDNVDTVCGGIGLIPVMAADLDTDGDGIADAISVGLEFSAEKTTILGIVDNLLGD